MFGKHEKGWHANRRQNRDIDRRQAETDGNRSDRRICGALVDVDPNTGRATAIERVMIDELELKQCDALEKIKVSRQDRDNG